VLRAKFELVPALVAVIITIHFSLVYFGADLTIALIASARARNALFGPVLAAFFSSHSILVLLFGVAGTHGNSIFTGLFFFALTGLVWFLTFRQAFYLSTLDFLFAGLVAAVLGSVVANGLTAQPKEYALLILSLSAYPACRFIRAGDLVDGRHGFVILQSMLVAVGVAVTVTALIGQWNDPHGKPLVFGFDGAATYFLQSLAFLVFAILMLGKLTIIRSFVLSCILVIPLAVFAASMVRFMFVALAATLVTAAFLSEPWRRANVLIVIAAIALSVAGGFASRSLLVTQYSIYAGGGEQAAPSKAGVSAAASGPSRRVPGCSSDASVNLDNSIAIRKVLLRQAVSMLPDAGLFGIGLDGFMKRTCVAGHQIHNSFLQAAVEFGWLGGVLFAALVIGGLLAILREARRDDASRFLLCCLVFVVLLCAVHGRFSGEALVFALVGAVAGFKQPARAQSTVAQTSGPLAARCQ
jgi:O-antigen ligase